MKEGTGKLNGSTGGLTGRQNQRNLSYLGKSFRRMEGRGIRTAWKSKGTSGRGIRDLESLLGCSLKAHQVLLYANDSYKCVGPIRAEIQGWETLMGH